MADIYVTTGGNAVTNGENFQDALDTCECGDNIILQAGATYKGANSFASVAFTLPDHGDCTGNPITIRTSAVADLAEGRRISPADDIGSMATILADTTSAGMQVIAPATNANHYKLIGLEITTTIGVYAAVLVNTAPLTQTFASIQAAIGFEIDRCFIHAPEISAGDLFATTEVRKAGKGVAAEGVDIVVKNSYIAGFTGRFTEGGDGIDSMGVFTVVGPGPLLVENNYIEAQYANMFFGGGDNYTGNTATVSSPTTTSATLSNVTNLSVGDYIAFPSSGITPHPWQTGQVTLIDGNDIEFTLIQGDLETGWPDAPDNGGTARWNGLNVSNVTVQRNFFSKPDAWNVLELNAKAWIELKDCVDCTFNGNQFYAGVPSNFAPTSRNQGGSAPWSEISNLTVTNNIFEGYGQGVVSLTSDHYHPNTPGSNWLFHNNLFITPRDQDFGTFFTTGAGRTGGDDVTITHNTIVQPQLMLSISGTEQSGFFPITGFTFKDNIAIHGVFCPNGGHEDLEGCFPSWDFTGNVVIGPAINGRPYCTDQDAYIYPAGNNCVDEPTDVGFIDYDNNNFRLASDSPYKNTASDDTDPGVNFDQLYAALGLPSGRKAKKGRVIRGRH